MVAQRLEKKCRCAFSEADSECETERDLPCFEADALHLARTLFRKLFLH